MADEDLRQLQRDAAGGDPIAEARLLVERLRAGTIDRARVELAAGLGHGPAAQALGEAPELELLGAFRRLALLGKEAWVRGVIALLREPPQPDDPQDADVQALVDLAHAWVECPCEDHRRGAQQGHLRQRDPSWIQHVVSGGSSARLWAVHRALDVIAKEGDAVFRSQVLCSGLSGTGLASLEEQFADAGCLTHSVPDSAVPARDRRSPRSRAHPSETLGGEGLVVEDPGPRKVAVVSAIRRATGLGLLVLRTHLNRGELIPTGLCLADAERLAAELTEQGATVSLVDRPAEDGAAASDGEGRSLVLDDIGLKMIMAIKEIRSVTGFGLREAKDIADTVGSALPAGAHLESWRVVSGRLASVVPWLLS